MNDTASPPPPPAKSASDGLLRKLLIALGIVGLLLALYSGLGFWLTPRLIQHFAPKLVHEKLERKAEIAVVEFNPFKLHFVARGFKFSEASGAPLAAFDEAVVDVAWSSITQWAIVFNEIRLTRPSINVELSKDGKLNWLAVIDKLNEGRPPNNDPPPRFLIQHLKITQGRVDFHDRKAAYNNALTPIDFQLSNFSTLPNHVGPYSLAANIAQGGIVRWRGEASANPIQGRGEFALDNISVPNLANWLKVLPGADFTAGRFTARLPYQFAYSDARVSLSTAGAEAGVTELDIRRKGGETLLKLGSASISKIAADINTREVTIDAIKLSDGHIGATRGADGRLDWQAAMAEKVEKTEQKANATANTANSHFKLAIKDIALEKFLLKFSDGPALAQVNNLNLQTALSAEMKDGALSAALDSIKLASGPLAYKAGDLTAQVANTALQAALKLQSQSGAMSADLGAVTLKTGELSYAGGGNSARAAGVEAQTTAKAESKADQFNVTLDNARLVVRKTTAQWPGAGGAANLALDGVTAQAHVRMTGPKITVTGAQATLNNAVVTQNGQTPLQLGQAGIAHVQLDVAARSVNAERAFVQGLQTQVVIDDKGQPDLLNLVPAVTDKTPPQQARGTPWRVTLKSAELVRGEARIDHKPLGIAVTATAIEARAGVITSDLKQPVQFKAGFTLKEGGVLSTQGSANPGQGTVDANLEVLQLPLALAQPLLARHVKLKLASGTASTQGRLTTAADGALKFLGGAKIDDLKLVEDNGEHFASWKSVGAPQLSVSLKPDLAEIAELLIVEPNAKLLIEADRSLNAQRLLVNAPPPAVPTAEKPEAKPVATPAAVATTARPDARPDVKPAPATNDGFPVSIGRVRVQNGFLDFADLSLRPQFAAKIHELTGVVTGLSTAKATRSLIELDGRVDEFGLARIRGELNPFAPRDNTDVTMIFRNVDLVSASPYSMKFAGYRIAGGKISLDLNYKVRNSQLLGENKIVLDQLTLGERVDSPDAIRLPLTLAIAILRDSDGRIDLGLPVSGSLDDPKFSYGDLIWKAIVNLLTRIVTAPFRALGSLFGGAGEKLESIDFDPGSARLLPPEREKLKSVAQVLAKRPQLALAVPAQYSNDADSAALRERALRVEVLQKTGGKPPAEGTAGAVDPINLQERSVRNLLRDLYAARFGKAEYEKLRADAERGVLAGKPAADKSTGRPGAELPIWRRALNLAQDFTQGEPRLADSGPFYDAIIERLQKTQPIPDTAVRNLGRARSDAIAAALKADGIESARVAQPAGENVAPGANKLVPVKLGLAAR